MIQLVFRLSKAMKGVTTSTRIKEKRRIYIERNIFRKTLQQLFISCGFLFFLFFFHSMSFNAEIMKAVEQNKSRSFQAWICPWTLVFHSSLYAEI